MIDLHYLTEIVSFFFVVLILISLLFRRYVLAGISAICSCFYIIALIVFRDPLFGLAVPIFLFFYLVFVYLANKYIWPYIEKFLRG